MYIEIVTKEMINQKLILLVGCGQTYPGTPNFCETSQKCL